MKDESVSIGTDDGGQQRGYERHIAPKKGTSISRVFGRNSRLLYREHHAMLDRQKIEQLVDDEPDGLDFAPNFLEAHLVER